SSSMEADIIVEGFMASQEMHGVRYMKLIGDGDSNVMHKIRENVPYGRHVEKIECANHCVRNYTSKLYDLLKNAEMKGFLTKAKIQRLTAAARGAINHQS